MAELLLESVSQRYAEAPVIDRLGFHLPEGEIGCLLGASGCGKTTALRCIAGFEPIAGGEIRVGGELVSRAGWSLAPERRRIGMVFQDYALFPHLTVADNIGFGLRGDPGRTARITAMLELVGLNGLARAWPHQLSGGQQQRVALARALAPRPRLLLMDEPFSNLDVELRERLSLEVRRILKREGSTALIVTHDQHEAFALADQVGVMHQGRLQQWAAPYDLYHEPANRFVAGFIGQGVMLPGRLVDEHRVQTELGDIRGRLPANCQARTGDAVDLLLRPDDVVHDDASPLQAKVANRAFRGAEFLYTLELPSGQPILSLVPSHHDHPVGMAIGIRLQAQHLVAFPR